MYACLTHGCIPCQLCRYKLCIFVVQESYWLLMHWYVQHCDQHCLVYGQTNFPLRLAVDMNIPLIMYGENGEVEYGGDMTNANIPTRQVSQHNSHYFSNFPPEVWQKYGLNINDLKPFMGPTQEQMSNSPIEIHFMS